MNRASPWRAQVAAQSHFVEWMTKQPRATHKQRGVSLYNSVGLGMFRDCENRLMLPEVSMGMLSVV